MGGKVWGPRGCSPTHNSVCIVIVSWFRADVCQAQPFFTAMRRPTREIAFKMGDRTDMVLHNNIDICYTIEENEWNGKVNLQLMVKDIRIAE